MKKNMNLITAGVGAFSGLVIILSLFLDYLGASVLGIKIKVTGWDYLNPDNNAKGEDVFLILVSTLLAIALIVVSGLLVKKILDPIIPAIVGMITIIFGIIIFIMLPDSSLKAQFGLILNFIFSIIGGLALIAPFAILKLDKK